MALQEKFISDTEYQRLNALESYNILDTLPEKEYDAITRLASYICKVPISLITFIDLDRQWFKSKVGIDDEETLRSDAFCNHTILSNDILEIKDTLKSDVFRDNAYVKNEPHIRFYAGAPLIDPNGYRLGSLCVVDQVPRELTDDQRDALRILASEVMSQLILRREKHLAEESLIKHGEFYNLFNNSGEVHCITDRDFNIQLINNAAYKTLGYQPEELVGKPIWNFFLQESKSASLEVLRKGIKSQKRFFEIETLVVTKNGKIRCMSWSVSYSHDKWYTSGRDITEQKEIASQLEQLSLVASKVDNGVVISNAKDEVVWINEGFENLTGYSLEDVESKFLGEVLKGKPSKKVTNEQMDLLLLQSQPYEVDFAIKHKNGRPMWISVMKSVLKDEQGGVVKQIRIISDITAKKKAEQDLELLSFAASKSSTGMLIRDAEGNVIWMNEALEIIFGYSLEEMKGRKFGDILVGPETDLEMFEKASKSLKQNKPYTVEMKVYRKGGIPTWVYINNSPFFNETGQIDHHVGVVVDITERKLAEERLTMLSLVASSTTSGVVINNKNGMVEWVSSAFENITGYGLEDVQNKHLGDVLKGELTDVAVIEQARELSKLKQSFEVDLQVYRKDGKPLWISVINSVILNDKNEVEKYIEVIIDITDKKQAEFQLVDAKEEAQQLSKAKDMFISVLSHEIRTPLNAVIGMSRLLHEENHLEAQEENLSILKFSAENLMNLINDVLDFTKIETGNIELESAEVNLRELIEGITKSMQFRTNDKNIYLKGNVDEAVPPTVIGDRTRICQILLNLAGNSVKFTEEGGITIDLKVIEQTQNNVTIRFAVNDTGIGIAADKIDTIFESFKQAEADTTRKYGGTGLGLAITKKLVELHGARINVDSTPGKGSSFWFTAKFSKGQVQGSAYINNSIVETELQLNVLVVDDNQINRLLINKVITKWGATVDFAENGLEAVAKIEGKADYDVVLMDIHMPVMGGLEATEIIRSKSEAYFQQLPIIALTASMLTSEVNEITRAGMNDYILKPFDPKGLYDKLARYQNVS
ncbi:PAS domain S-box protein [Mucilaginibacter sp. BT774]|uniref:PAS domain S-box protein n=1 Tax=Mucilaginibacter sp. BT774 TaxID=3062276 RepID=UPI00267488F3|nr:PAS domain S-box protein [Mucilaginibacter sp. BT774]MDO3626826.1 PAS domain S-box protein [Mucilaginibacter sp. BT774]